MRFKKEELSHFEDKLNDERVEIESNLKAYEKELDFGDDTESKDSFEEETDEAEEEATYLGVRDALDKRLRRLTGRLPELMMGSMGFAGSAAGRLT